MITSDIHPRHIGPIDIRFSIASFLLSKVHGPYRFRLNSAKLGNTNSTAVHIDHSLQLVHHNWFTVAGSLQLAGLIATGCKHHKCQSADLFSC